MYLSLLIALSVVSFIRFLTAFYRARQEVWKLQKANLVLSPTLITEGPRETMELTMYSLCQSSSFWLDTLGPLRKLSKGCHQMRRFIASC